MSNDPIQSIFATSIGNTERAITDFIDPVDGSYKPNATEESRAVEYAILRRQSQIGSYRPDGSYEPLRQGHDLNYKLRSLDLTPNLNTTMLRAGANNYATAIYSGMGFNLPTSQTFAGDLAQPNSSWVTPALSDKYINNPNRTDLALGGGVTRTLIGESGLEGAVTKLANTLSMDYGIKIEVNRITAMGSNSPTHLSITVPNIEVNYNGTILGQEGERDLLRSSAQTFVFTTTESGGVLEAGSNRYIGKSLLRTPEKGTVFQSAFETATGYVATYVLQQQIILDQGTSLAFKQFLENQSRFNPSQTYIELDRFLGKAVGQNLPFSQYVNSIADTATAQDFLNLQNELGKKLNIGLPTERFSQVSNNQMAEIRTTTIGNILKPLGEAPNKQAAAQQLVANLASVLLNPEVIKQYKLDKYGNQIADNSIRVDLFTALKQEILGASSAGNAVLAQQITAMRKQELATGRKNLIDQLRSPFLQPHETNYSGAQQLGKLPYYERDQSGLTAADGRTNLMQQGGVYKHGSVGAPIGKVFIQISAQSSGNQSFNSQFHDSQLSSTSRETVNFFDLEILFNGSAQLNTTSIGNIDQALGNYQGKDEWLTTLQQTLHLDNFNQVILLTPYGKPEQIQQRLKNLSGTRPAIEYSLDFYKDIMSQKDLSKYYAHNAEGERTMLNDGAAVSANLNAVLPAIQFERAKALHQETQGTNRSFIGEIRTNEANPQAEVRGYATNSRAKLVLVPTGANQGSDFMHLNAAHEATYGYKQYSKVEVNGVFTYDTAGGKLYASNIGADMQRHALQTAFSPGNIIYYGDTPLQHVGTQNTLTSKYDRILAKYAGESGSFTPSERKAILNNAHVRQDVNEMFKKEHSYIRGVSYNETTGGFDFTLKAGLYNTSTATITNLGLFDGDGSRLLLGLTPTINQQGEMQAQQLSVKISGTLRKEQQGVAIVNDLLNFSEVNGRTVGHASYTILFDGSVRPGVPNVKGPARYDDRALFDHYANLFQDVNYTTSARTQTDNPIYGIVSEASFKGYNYETGLDVLTTAKSTDLFLARLRRGGMTSTALFASYFAADLKDLATNQTDKARLSALSTQLKSAIEQQLRSSGEYDRHLEGFVDQAHSNKSISKNADLFVSNTGFFDLLDPKANGHNLGFNAPLAQLQETLLSALTSGDDRVLNRAISLMHGAIGESFEYEGYRSFGQHSGNVRAAGLISDILGTSYAIVDYARARDKAAPLAASILELNFLDARGRVNHDLLLGDRHLAATSLLHAAKVTLPRAEVMEKLRSRYAAAQRAGVEFTPGKRNAAEYGRFTEEVANIYAASQAAIPLLRATIIAPSKILQAAGSKESVNLELQYALAMSTRQVDKMRGYVSDPNQLTDVTAAYRTLVKMTQSKSLHDVKFMSPFLGSQQTEDYRVAYAGLEHASSLVEHLTHFGEGLNKSLYAEYARASVAGDRAGMERIITGMQAIDATARFYTGSSELQLADRAVALATSTDNRRSTLAHLTHQANTFDLNKPHVFFDLETSGLMDKRYPESDARRYTGQSINELTFVFGNDVNARTISWSHKQINGEFATREAALAEVTRLLNGQFKDAALVGHNVRKFDIPTLAPLVPGIDLNSRQVIDTLHDADRKAVKATLGTNKFNLRGAYKQVTRLTLELLSGDAAAQEQLRSGEYGEFKAHEALHDVHANMELFHFMVERDLFSKRQAPLDPSRLGGSRLFEQGSVIYYDRARAGAGSLFVTARELAINIHQQAGSSHLGYHYDSQRERYQNEARQDAIRHGLNQELVISYTEHLLFDNMSGTGRFAMGKDKTTQKPIEDTKENVRAFLNNQAGKSDAKVEQAIASTFTNTDTTYLDSVQQRALAYKDEEVRLRVGGDLEGAKRASRLYSMLQETRVLVMPHLDVAYNSESGTFTAKLMAARPDEYGNKRAMLGNSLIYLGNDILSQLPKEFSDFVPRLTRERRAIDLLLPSYIDIMERIQSGQHQISMHDQHVLSQMQDLATTSRESIFVALGGAMSQRAFGEKTKLSGISSTSVASYLLHIDEVGLGTRFTSTLGQTALRRIAALQGQKYGADEVLVLRAGGPSGASQLDQTHRVVTMSGMIAAAEQMNTATKLDSKRNNTTSILPIYGRFMTQGGDFDGDSYSIVGKYQQELSSYADLLEENKKLGAVRHSLKKSILTSRDIYIEHHTERNYQNALLSKLQIQADYEHHQTTISTALSRAAAGKEIDRGRMFKSIWHLLSEQGFTGSIGQLESTPFTRALNLIDERAKSKLPIPASHQELGNFVDTLTATFAGDFKRETKVRKRLEYLKEHNSLTPELIRKTIQGAHEAYSQDYAVAVGKDLEQSDRLNPTPGGTVNFLRKVNGKTTTAQIEEEARRHLSTDDEASTYLARERAAANAKAQTAYDNGLNEGRFSDIPKGEVEFLQEKLTETNHQQQRLNQQIASKYSSVEALLGQTDGIASKAVDSMRRHVAAFTGLPAATFAKSGGAFNDAEVFSIIEQHRGVTPGFESLPTSVAKGGDFNLKVIETLSDLHNNYIEPAARQMEFLVEGHLGDRKKSSIFDRPAMLGLRTKLAADFMHQSGVAVGAAVEAMPDSEVKTAIQGAIGAVGIESYLGYTSQQRIDKTMTYGGSSNPVALAASTFLGMASKASGTLMSDKVFHALQQTIDATAGNIIGEAYNAITLVMGKAIVARSLSEALASSLPVASGVDSPATNFLQITKESFEKTIASNTHWQGDRDEHKLEQAKDLVSQIFVDPAPLARAAYNRAQNLTGMLGNIQQSIRDSLKQKVDGGLLQSIMSEHVISDRSIYDILTSDSGTDVERLPALRKFLSEDAGASIFNLSKERTYADRYKVTAFGALFLMSDYLKIENESHAEKMIGLNSTAVHDKNELQKYGYLAERYDQIRTMAAAGDHRASTMLDADRFIAESVLDLTAMSAAERSVFTMIADGKKDAQAGFRRMQVFREQAMVGFGSKVNYGFTNEQVGLQRSEYFSDSQERREYHHDIAASLFFDPHTGEDLLRTREQKEAAAGKLGFDYNSKEFKNIGEANFELYQRATTQFIFTRNKEHGMTYEDLRDMRSATQAMNYLRFESLEGNTIFKDFTQASANAIDALSVQSTRDQITDSHQMAAVSFEAGAQMVEAFGAVKTRMENKYGTLDLDRHPDVPQGTMRAYRATQTLAGVFTQLFNGQNVDPKVREYATEMFAISLAGTNKEGKSGWQELSHFLGGMAQLTSTQDSLMHAREHGINNEVTEMHEAYSTAKARDLEEGATNKIGPRQVDFVTQLGKIAGTQSTAPTTMVTAHVEHGAEAIRKQARTSLIGAFIGPALLTALSATQGDANLVEHGLVVVQAAAQVSEIHDPRRWTSATLFQIDRVKNTLRQDGLAIGAVKAITSELMFEAASRIAHKVAGSNQGAPIRNYLAEVGVAALSLVLGAATADRRYGALNEGEDTSQTQALIALPGMGIGIAESAIEEFMRANSVDSDFETTIDYEVSLSTKESTIAEAFSTGWLKQLSSEEGDERADSSMMSYNNEDLA